MVEVNCTFWSEMRFDLIRLVLSCIWRCILGFVFVGANSTCTFALFVLLRFEIADEILDKLLEDGLTLAITIDDDNFSFSLGFGFSTLTRDTEPREFDGFFGLESSILPFHVPIILRFCELIELICSSFSNAEDWLSSSSRLPSNSRMSSVT